MELPSYGYSLNDFMEEAKELLTRAEGVLSELRESPHDMGRVNALFRIIHSLKGSAAYAGLADVNTFTHLYESFLGDLKHKKYEVNRDVLNILTRATDYLEDLISRPESAEVLQIDESVGGSMRQMSAALAGRMGGLPSRKNIVSLSPPLGKAGKEVENSPSPAVIKMEPKDSQPVFSQYPDRMGQREIIKITIMSDLKALYLCLKDHVQEKAVVSKVFTKLEDGALWAFGESAELVRLIGEMKGIVSGDIGPHELLHLRKGFNSLAAALKKELTALDGPVRETKTEVKKEEKVKEDEKKISPDEIRGVSKNEINTQYSAIRNLQSPKPHPSSGATLRVKSEDVETLIRSVAELTGLESKDFEKLQAQALQLRMVPVGELFSRFRKVVRDLSEELNKEINIEISGESVKLDKVIADRLNEPIMHLIRNAASHGLEGPEERRRAGKGVVGLISLSAYQEGGQVVIEVSDNGRGIAFENIRKRGMETGMIKADEGNSLSEKTLLDLIFMPGFSTMEEADRVSGRGIGMDVVKEVVTSLQGSVAIDTKEGTGTTFRLQLPLTLAIIKGMVLDQGGTMIALPANFVDRVIPMTEEELKAGSIMDNNRPCLAIPGEGEVLPLFDLLQVFGLRTRSKVRCVVVVRAGTGQKTALVADSAIGRRALMIKPLDRFAENRYFSSASFADNELILVLNTPSLMAA